jgi:hypothetical protein
VVLRLCRSARKRFIERALYYMENPQYGKKRLGRALGLVPPPAKLKKCAWHRVRQLTDEVKGM